MKKFKGWISVNMAKKVTSSYKLFIEGVGWVRPTRRQFVRKGKTEGAISPDTSRFPIMESGIIIARFEMKRHIVCS